MTRAALRHAAALALLLLAAGCQSTPDRWGPYEDSVLQVEREFRDQPLLDEIQALESHLEQLRLHDLLPPPGVHAHLGYLQYLAGSTDAAARHFDAEKTLYPESRVFIDGLLTRMRR